MRRARVGCAHLVLRIAQGAHDVLLEGGWRLQGRGHGAQFQAPRRVLQRLGGRAMRRNPGSHRAGQRKAAAQQRAAVEQAVAGDRL